MMSTPDTMGVGIEARLYGCEDPYATSFHYNVREGDAANARGLASSRQGELDNRAINKGI